MGIQLKPPGVTDGIPIDASNRRPQLQLKHPGIHLIYFEKASVLYYWEPDGFKQFVTSD